MNERKNFRLVISNDQDLRLRMEKDLYIAILKEAQKQSINTGKRVSMNKLILDLLSEKFLTNGKCDLKAEIMKEVQERSIQEGKVISINSITIDILKEKFLNTH